MFRTVGRFLLLRVLPRRLLPILTVVEVARLLRSARRQRASSRAARQAGRWDPAFDAHRARSTTADPRH